MSKMYRSDALGAVHETASDLHDAGLMDKRDTAQFRRTLPDSDKPDATGPNPCAYGQSSSIFCGLPPRLRRSPSRVTIPRQPHLQFVLGH